MRWQLPGRTREAQTELETVVNVEEWRKAMERWEAMKKGKTVFGVPEEETAPSPARVADPPFPCVGCGACCAAVSHVPELVELGWVLPNGVCRHLDTKTKKCSIYEDRPTVCRIDKVRPPLVKVESWHALNWNVCGYLHKQLLGSSIEKQGEKCTHAFPVPKNAIVEPDGDADDAATEPLKAVSTPPASSGVWITDKRRFR